VHARREIQAVVGVTFQPYGDGARVLCEARVDGFSLAFVAAWCGGVFLMGAIVAILLLSGVATPTPGTPLGLTLLPPIGMMAVAIFIPWRGQRSVRMDIDFIACALAETLEAERKR